MSKTRYRSSPTRVRAHAHATLASGAYPDEVNGALGKADLDLVQHLVADLRSRAWRRLANRRAQRILTALRHIEESLGNRYLGRERVGPTWLVFAKSRDGNRVAALQLTPPIVTAFSDFAAPIFVLIGRPDLVDPGALRRRLRHASVQVEWTQ